MKIPDFDWIPADREGITFNDATSGVFAQPIEWPKCDVVTFSWQKVLGGEGAHGMLILSPRAIARLESYVPPWPLPKIFRMTKKGRLDQELFDGAIINTPSLLATEDYIDALKWAPAIRSNASVCLRVVDARVTSLPQAAQAEFARKLADILEERGVALDAASYRSAPAGLRFWCGATIEQSDVQFLTP